MSKNKSNNFAREFFGAARAFCLAKKIFAAALLATALASCDFFTSDDSGAQIGAITLGLPSAEQMSASAQAADGISRAVTSSGSISATAVKSFRVRARSSSGGSETIQTVAPSSSVSISPLLPGFWEVTVFGLDASGQTVYYGKTGGIIVMAGQTTPATVTINSVNPNTPLVATLKEASAALPAQGRANITSAYVSVSAEGKTKSVFCNFSNADATKQPQDDNKITVMIPCFFEPGTSASAKVYLFGSDDATGNGKTAYWGGTVTSPVKADGSLEADLNFLDSRLVESNPSVNKLDVKMDKELDSQLTGGSGMGYEFAVKTGDATAPVSSGLNFYPAVADACGEVPLIVECEGKAWCDEFRLKHPVILPAVEIPDQFPLGVSKAFSEVLTPAEPKEWPLCKEADSYDEYGYKQYSVQGVHKDDWKGIEFASPSGGVMANHYYTPSGAGATPTHAQTVNTDSDTCTWTKTIESKNYGYFEDGSIDVKELSGSFTVTGAAWTITPAAIEVEKGGTFSFTLTNAAANEADCQAVSADLNFKVIPGTSSSGTAVTTTQTAKGSSVVVAVTAPASWSAGSSKALSVWLGTASALGSDDSGVKTFTVNVTAASSGGGGSGGSGSGPQGMTYGEFVQMPFSIAADKQVYFSPGNLWYQASTSTFKFSEHQYDIVGKDANEAAFTAFISNNPTSYKGWTDLFEWGSSGAGIAGIDYPPYTRKFPDGLSSEFYNINGLTGANAELDWGVHNAITNGGNQPGLWRTLTWAEWSYLFHTRSGAPTKRAPARVNGIAGMILFPDTWNPESIPSGLTLNYTNSSNSYDYYGTNTYTPLEWSQFEALGAVFLPSTGCCYSVSSSDTHLYWDGVDGSNAYGDGTIYVSYWTASPQSSNASQVYATYTSTGGHNKADIGTMMRSPSSPAAVRLVQDRPDYYTVAPYMSNKIYVSSSGSASGNGSEASPLDSIDSAVTKILEIADAQDYTIYIDGQLTTTQSMNKDLLTQAYAKSITIIGKNGIDSATGEPRDGFVGSYSSSNNANMLKIGTPVPVIIKNLKISGGYYQGGGIEVGCQVYGNTNRIPSDVTLGAGALITGNKASGNGGAGVWVSEESKLTVDGAIISANTLDPNTTSAECQGAAIYSLGKELVIKGDSKITANTCRYSGGNYSAVYCEKKKTGDKVIIGDNAEISNNAVRGLYIKGVPLTLKGHCKITGNQNLSTSSSNGAYYGGGIFATAGDAYEITISENAEISGNSAKNAGGLCIWSYNVTVNFSGGSISGNTLTDATGKGKGVYLWMGTITEDRFIMSGTAVIASNNDIYLGSAKSKITAGSLTPPSGVTTVATITPYEYQTTSQVLNGSLAGAYQLFAVTPDGDTAWYVGSNGYLTQTQP